jgi:hypothetical protein
MTSHTDESAERVYGPSADTDPQSPPPAEIGTAGDRGATRRARALAVAAGLTVAALVLGNLVALVVLVPLLVLGGTVSPLLLVGISVFGVQVVGFVGVSLLYARRTGRRAFLVRRPTGRDALWVGGGVIAALLIAAGAGVVMTELGLEPTSGIADLGELDTRVFLVLIPLSVLVIAPTEELLFRGVIQGRLRESFGPVAAVVAASIFFGSIHFLNFGGPLTARLAPTLAITLVSLLFGYAYERTGNLLVPVVMHGGYNAALLAVTYLSIVGL